MNRILIVIAVIFSALCLSAAISFEHNDVSYTVEYDYNKPNEYSIVSAVPSVVGESSYLNIDVSGLMWSINYHNWEQNMRAGGTNYFVTIGTRCFKDWEDLRGITFCSWNNGNNSAVCYVSIGDRAFFNRVIDLTLSDNVKIKSVGKSAFAWSSISMWSGNVFMDVESIGASAFYEASIWVGGCSSVEFNNISEIGAGAFWGFDSSPSDISLSGNFRTLPEGCFHNSGISSILITGDMEEVCPGAFADCKILENVTWPSNVTINIRKEFSSYEIEESSREYGIQGYRCDTSGIFSGCSRLQASPPFANLETIPTEIFMGCSSISEIDIPQGVTNISESAFRNCTALSCVSFPTGLISIASSAFYGCSAITNVDLHEGLKYIGPMSFYNCGALSDLHLPNGINKIDYGAFANCNSLTSVEILGCTDFGCGSVSMIDYTYGFARWVTVEAGPFSSCANLQRAVVSNDVLNLSESMFSNCTSLKAVLIYGNVLSVGPRTFKGCGELENATFLGSIREVSEEMFAGCSSLRQIPSLPLVSNIMNGAFSGCVNLTGEFVVSDAITNISSTAFNGTYIRMIIADGSVLYEMVDGGVRSKVSKQIVWIPAVSVEIVETNVRIDDPTILDVKYIVKSGYDYIDTRVLAYENGTRSWVNIVRPETFVATPNGLISVIGNGISGNSTNMFSWKVSSDYTNNLAQLKVEIFVKPEGLLPLDLMTIPAHNSKPTLEVSYNVLSEANVMNALYWLYADKQPELSLTNGRLTANGVNVAQGTSVYGDAAVSYVFGKMGYQKLTNANYLGHVNSDTRLGLSPSGTRQYAVREIAE